MITFYIPEKVLNENWDQEDMLHETSKNGGASWIVQTYLWLKKYSDENIEIKHTIPEQGIVISHRCFIPDNYVPNPSLYLVCIQADWGRHVYGHHHISQNPEQINNSTMPLLYRLFFPLNTQFVHYWPQPNILPREPSRKLENICFFGLKYNLAPELQSTEWVEFIKSLGLNWVIKENRHEWNDYRDADLVLFIRDFGTDPHLHKPGTKLYNTWIAGSVPIHQKESAYVYETNKHPGCSVEVASFQELKDKLAEICANPQKLADTRESITKIREEYLVPAITNEWVDIIKNVKLEYARWKKSTIKRYFFFTSRHMLYLVKHKLLRQKSLVQ